MRVKLEMRGGLPGGRLSLDLPAGATVADALALAGLAWPEVLVIWRDTVLQDPAVAPLAEGDVLVVLPPLAGG